jgi:DNA-binding PucR family transcriptional regulator
LDAGAGRGWAESLLAPLQNADGRVDLIQTVRTFLANNGSNEAAAGALGIHRRSLS